MTKLIFYCALMLFSSVLSEAAELAHITNISLLESLDNDAQVTAPYHLLADTLYATDMNTYVVGKHKLEILDKNNPEKIVLRITENVDPQELRQPVKSERISLPWWSNSAPGILRELDFSMVDGKASAYKIGDNYRLTLLARQGSWGMVYVLEQICSGEPRKIICAVKLLLTRDDKTETVENYRERHQQEIDSNLKLASLRMDIAIEPYGILENDQDHYLLFLEYGDNARDQFKECLLDETVDKICELIEEVNKLHAAGYAHGDLKIDNILLVNNKIKLCDWFSLSSFTNECVGKYRYFGDNLPPEAMRALYFRDDNALKYAVIGENSEKSLYILHPIAADRFCLAISLLEILEPDLYHRFDQLLKNFNPYRPESLDFWPKHVTQLREIRSELLLRASKTDHLKKRQLLLLIANYINVDPSQRI